MSATKKPKSKVLPRRRDREDAIQTAEILWVAFDWRNTPQGARYWGRVYRNLRMLAGAEP